MHNSVFEVLTGGKQHTLVKQNTANLRAYIMLFDGLNGNPVFGIWSVINRLHRLCEIFSARWGCYGDAISTPAYAIYCLHKHSPNNFNITNGNVPYTLDLPKAGF